MRKPRAIDAELAALAERATLLKARRVTQLGELVVASGADGLGADILMGALLAAAAEGDEAVLKRWHAGGEAFFQGDRAGRSAPGAPDSGARSGASAGADAEC